MTDSGRQSDEKFVEFCYRHLLRREGDPAGIENYVRALSAGLDRHSLVRELIDSDEFRQLVASDMLNAVAPGSTTTGLPTFAPPGHFYSPLPAAQDVDDFATLQQPGAPWRGGLDLDEQGQLELLRTFAGYYEEIPFVAAPSAEHLFHFENGSFGYFDGIALYSFLRHFRPSRIVEVGSGFSSALMHDTNRIFFGGGIDLTVIDPFPEQLRGLLQAAPGAAPVIIEEPVQRVGLDTFTALGENDILFIDSSHVMKFGSDVSYLLLEVLPALRPGVLVHVHDIFANFDYPELWLREGRAWNEGYALKAFLLHNRDFRVLLFNDYLAENHWNELEQHLPLCTRQPQGSPFRNAGVSLWLQRCGAGD